MHSTLPGRCPNHPSNCTPALVHSASSPVKMAASSHRLIFCRRHLAGCIPQYCAVPAASAGTPASCPSYPQPRPRGYHPARNSNPRSQVPKPYIEVKLFADACACCNVTLEVPVYQCTECKKLICHVCDVYVHETLQSCPGCLEWQSHTTNNAITYYRKLELNVTYRCWWGTCYFNVIMLHVSKHLWWCWWTIYDYTIFLVLTMGLSLWMYKCCKTLLFTHNRSRSDWRCCGENLSIEHSDIPEHAF